MKWRVLVGEKTTWKMCGRFEQARKDCFVQREVKKISLWRLFCHGHTLVGCYKRSKASQLYTDRLIRWTSGENTAKKKKMMQILTSQCF